MNRKRGQTKWKKKKQKFIKGNIEEVKVEEDKKGHLKKFSWIWRNSVFVGKTWVSVEGSYEFQEGAE